MLVNNTNKGDRTQTKSSCIRNLGSGDGNERFYNRCCLNSIKESDCIPCSVHSYKSIGNPVTSQQAFCKRCNRRLKRRNPRRVQVADLRQRNITASRRCENLQQRTIDKPELVLNRSSDRAFTSWKRHRILERISPRQRGTEDVGKLVFLWQSKHALRVRKVRRAASQLLQRLVDVRQLVLLGHPLHTFAGLQGERHFQFTGTTRWRVARG